MNTMNNTTGNGNDVIPGTDWTYADALDMATEVRRDNRLFGNRSRRRSAHKRNNGVGLMVTNPARFEAETGWSAEDALQFALDERREQRIFGSGFGRIADDDVEPVADTNLGNDFYVIDEDGCIDKQATRERRLFGSRVH